MYSNILVATDGSDFANRAVEEAASMAAALDAEPCIVTVSEPLPVFSKSEIGFSLPADIYERMHRADEVKARHILDAAVAITRRHGRAAGTVHIAGQHPYAGILEAAKTQKADLIVLASRSKTIIDRIFIGSQASKVLSLADIPVLVVKV